MLDNLQLLADELGTLEARLAPFRSDLARAELIKKAIRAAFVDAAADSEHTITGERYSVAVGACGNVSVIDSAELLKRIGADKYVAIVTPTLKAIADNCGAGVLAAVTSTRQCGPRPLTVSPYVAPAPAAAAVAKKPKTATKTDAVAAKPKKKAA